MTLKQTTIAATLAIAGALLPMHPAWAGDQEPGHGSCQHGTPPETNAKNDGAGVKLADKCPCEGKQDCTCKKGACKCPKCGVHRQDRPRGT